MILLVIFIVLMMFWAFCGVSIYEPGKPYVMGNTWVPWLCVAILGFIIFSGYSVRL
jgi:hypothetical protein